jgi:hypothetical protein
MGKDKAERQLPWEENEETPICYVFGRNWGFEVSEDIEGKLYRWNDDAAEFFSSTKWSTSYGAPECPNCIVWTQEGIYFIVQYDGATWWERIPRNPQPMRAPSIGG